MSKVTVAASQIIAARSLPKVPTRDQILSVQMSFQGLKINTPTYGQIYWWETAAWFPNRADRQAAYAAKKAAGDSHIIYDLVGAYKELPDEYNQNGADFSNNLPAFKGLLEEGLSEGLLLDVRLGADGQGFDPVGQTMGHDWLMTNFPRIFDALKDYNDYIIWVPGYDGVFYGWTPEQIVAFGQLARSVGAKYLGIEFNTGHIPLGEGGADYQPGGRMQDYDVLYGEFNPTNYHDNNTWGIVGRLIQPYNRPADDTPANNGNDHDPRPFLLGTPGPRGPWYFIAFEILTYLWVRGQISDAQVAAYRSYFRDMGCRFVC